MKKTRNIGKSYLKLASMLVFPFALFGTGATIASQNNVSSAKEASYSYSTGYRENVDATNPSFVSGSSPYAQGPSLSGWNATVSGSKAKGMIIDVGDAIESEEEVETTTFANYKNTYALSVNPMAKDKNDTRILMINSKTKSTEKNIREKQGYKSSSVSLEANSYYVFKVSAKTLLNGDDFAECSIYLSGLKDQKGKTFDLAYEKISPKSWTDYYFFVATGDDSQAVNLELYLGSKSTASEGAVFFDATSIYRYSENEFYELCLAHNYQGTDSKTITDGDKIFMIDKLASTSHVVADIENYNFDFENSTALVTDNWKIISKPNGDASIINYADFESETGMPKIGNDLSYNNDRALVMQTTSNEYSSSHIGLQSKQIQIKPHAAYKVSLKLKIANMESGSFYLKLVESDYLYEVYSSQISEGDVDLKNQKTSGYTANVTNNWTNDYQTVDMYVKGHSLYTSFVNLELWLGDDETGAVGCVVIDDISVETISDAEIDSANCLTLVSNTEEGSITNFSFDSATNATNEIEYPLQANGWTATKANEDLCESGVVYLDSNVYSQLGDQNVYDMMYDGKYDWAGINPGNSNKSNKPSNVYMMFNRQNSHQSLQSPTFELKDNDYYKISFDFYNQNYGTTNASKFKIELIDKNGIALFSQNDIQSVNEDWTKFNVFVKSDKATAQSMSIKIYFGEKGDEVGGMLYLDKFTFENATEDEFNGARYSTDTTGFYTKLDLEKESSNRVVDSTAYSFNATSLDSNYTDAEVAFGGIANGSNNAYDIENADDNLLVITTTASAKANLKSNFTKNFKANSYYKLTFSLKTIFNVGADNASTDEHKCAYGASIKFSNQQEISNLITDGELKEYTIYIKTGDSATDQNLEFALNSDCDATTGTAVLTNLKLEETDEDTYLFALKEPSYNKNVFSSEFVESEVEEPEEDDDIVDEEVTENDNSNVWFTISSLIFALALVIAIAGLALKQVKIKKIAKVKSQVYDRRLNVNHELIMAQAQKMRDEEVELLISARTSFENEKSELEAAHKEYMREVRTQHQGKISKAVEKRFKQYTSNVARINEKLNIIKEKLNYAMSADHLIELEKKIIANQDGKKDKHKK